MVEKIHTFFSVVFVMLSGKQGTGITKVRMFGNYRSIITLVTILRLHYEGIVFQKIMRDIMASDFEGAVSIFVEKVGESYTLYLDEESFQADEDDGREVMLLGGEYKQIQ